MNQTAEPRGWRSLVGGACVVIAALVGSLLTPVAATAADQPAAVPDGLTSETAAGSCWEIKQNSPNSADGVYWLVTPALVAPEQFYCDQTTDGGGWVLIARGRDAWKEGYYGLRSPELIRNTPTGTGAFQPAQLAALKVDGLLNNTRVDALTDGIRLRRAANTGGTQWQETRFKFQQRDRWVWTFGAEHRVAWYSFNGAGANTTNQTNNFGADQLLRRVNFQERSSHEYRLGWAYGSSQAGSDAANSYMWAPQGQRYAVPFTQVYLRPQLKVAEMNFGVIPTAGTPASTVKAIPESDARATVWGVSGLANGLDGELNTEVAEFAEAGGTVFVGGNFRYVQRTQAGGSQTEQPYLAGFNVNTGEWVSSFRPVFNGQVKALAPLDDGRIAVGGDFSQVNGVAQAGIAFLDRQTGQLSGPQAQAENRLTGGVVAIRDMEVRNGFLYVAGAFTHLAPIGGGQTASARSGGRINMQTSRPDINWNANLNGTSWAVHPNAQGDRAYYAGYFKQRMSTTQPGVSVDTPSGAAFQVAAGAPLVEPLWQPQFSVPITGAVFQFGVTELDGKVWLGGSEHSLFAYDRDTFQRLRGSITKSGGDFQTVENDGSSLVVAGCHCGHWVYQDAYTWSGVGTGWTQADKMNIVGLWEAGTGDYVEEWSPVVTLRRGFGAWGTFFDSTGTLWIGGDFNRSNRANEVSQWSGGFVRFAARDAVAPTTPGGLSITPSSSTTATLSWGASTDPGGVTYEVIRGNRVVASTTTNSYTLNLPDEPTQYYVRARDAAGNRSASTAALAVEPPSENALTFIENGEEWSWRYNNDALPADWNTLAFDDDSWSKSQGLFARGVAGAATNIEPTALSPRPLSAQFRKAFEVEDAISVEDGSVTVIADDGVVVYLNGVELGRTRMPASAPQRDTYASTITTHAAAAAARATYEVPRGLLVDGENVIAASVHANYRNTPDLSFDLAFTAERGEAPEAPGAVTTLTATATAHDSVDLAWVASSVGEPAVSYTVQRNGVDVATVTAPATTHVDTGLSPETTYEYSVIAVSELAGPSAPTTVSATTLAAPDPGQEPVTIVNGEEWSWRYSNDTLPTDWNTLAFDDASWTTSSGLFARGVAGAATNIEPTVLSPRPLSAQFRKTFEVEDALSVEAGTLTVLANDGVVVYLNGVELGRAGMPTGALHRDSYATSVRTHAAAVASPSTFAVPRGLLSEGENVIAVSVHANYRSTPDLSFDLSLTAERGESAQAPGAVTSLAAEATTHETVNVTWQAPADGAPAASYRITRNGEAVGTVTAPTTTFVDTGLDPETEYEYGVVAVSEFGAASAAATATVATSEAPEPGPEPLTIANGGEWRWLFSNDALPADWNAVIFDDSSWATGSGLFARGVAGAATNIEPTPLSPRPLSAQFRKAFEVDGAANVLDGTVTVIADDGVVLYLNGTELGRQNLPAGTLGQNSYATSAPRSNVAAANQATFVVPASLLVDGSNVISASVHANYRGTPDLSFDLVLTMPRQ